MRKKSGDAERVDSDRGLLCASEWGSERCARGQYGKVGNILYVRNVVHENVKRLIIRNGGSSYQQHGCSKIPTLGQDVCNFFTGCRRAISIPLVDGQKSPEIHRN